MSEDSPSLKAFILGDPPNAALSQCVASVTAALGTSLFDVRHFDWSSLAGDILEKLEQMFDIRVTDILAAAWKDYQALIDCADPAKHSADEKISLPWPITTLRQASSRASKSLSASGHRSGSRSRSLVISNSRGWSSRSRTPASAHCGSEPVAPKAASNAKACC